MSNAEKPDLGVGLVHDQLSLACLPSFAVQRARLLDCASALALWIAARSVAGSQRLFPSQAKAAEHRRTPRRCRDGRMPEMKGTYPRNGLLASVPGRLGRPKGLSARQREEMITLAEAPWHPVKASGDHSKPIRALPEPSDCRNDASDWRSDTSDWRSDVSIKRSDVLVQRADVSVQRSEPSIYPVHPHFRCVFP